MSDPSKYKISVIVPVYNVEKYLPKCIESILAQTYTNFELLLIDDGSPDRSGAICDEYAKRDSRIRVFHKENGGVSSSRNMGLDYSYGEWITFVDSDDTIDNATLQKGYDCISNAVKDVDLIQFGSSESTISYTLTDKQSAISSGKLRVNACANFFKNSIIKKHSIRFIEGLRLGEDQLFTFTYIHFCEFCMRIPTKLYHYRQIATSSTHNLNEQALSRSLQEIFKFTYRYEFARYLSFLAIGQLLRLLPLASKSNDKELALSVDKKLFRFGIARTDSVYIKVLRLICGISPLIALKIMRFVQKNYWR